MTQMPSNVANQVTELANAAVADAAHRRKVSADRAQQMAAVDAWLSRKRIVLIALLMAIPTLALIIAVNVMNVSLVDLFAPAPAPQTLQSAQQALDTVVQRVDSFHNDYNELPRNLVEVGVPAPGKWTWAPRSNGQYQVTVTMFSQTLTFDTTSRTPAP